MKKRSEPADLFNEIINLLRDRDDDPEISPEEKNSILQLIEAANDPSKKSELSLRQAESALGFFVRAEIANVPIVKGLREVAADVLGSAAKAKSAIVEGGVANSYPPLSLSDIKRTNSKDSWSLDSQEEPPFVAPGLALASFEPLDQPISLNKFASNLTVEEDGHIENLMMFEQGHHVDIEAAQNSARFVVKLVTDLSNAYRINPRESVNWLLLASQFLPEEEVAAIANSAIPSQAAVSSAKIETLPELGDDDYELVGNELTRLSKFLNNPNDVNFSSEMLMSLPIKDLKPSATVVVQFLARAAFNEEEINPVAAAILRSRAEMVLGSDGVEKVFEKEGLKLAGVEDDSPSSTPKDPKLLPVENRHYSSCDFY